MAPIPTLRQLKTLAWNAQSGRRLALRSDLLLGPTLEPFSFSRSEKIGPHANEEAESR